MIFHRSFQDNKLQRAKPYQIDAYTTVSKTVKENGPVISFQSGFENRPIPRSYSYDKNGYKFSLKECKKFDQTYLLKREDGSLSGILTESVDIELLSTKTGIETASVGNVADDIGHLFPDTTKPIQSDKNYCVEYGGNIVEIKKGEKVWLDLDGKIMIGWHGTYSPPHGM